MGQKIVLSDTTFTDTSLPKILNDPLIFLVASQINSRGW